MTTVREWRSEEWERSSKARSQEELNRMTRRIMQGADEVENKPTPGSSRDELSRCIRCKSSLIPGTEYIIHVEGFTVQDITEIIRN